MAAGRTVYMKRCWTCHGDAGQGEGPDAVDFVPPAADFTVDEFDTMPDYELMWKVSEGIGNTAMPIWRLLLSEEDRWNAIAYIRATFISPTEPATVDDNPPVAYQALDPAPYANTPDARDRGKATYEKLCLGCHGYAAKGDGQYGPPLAPTPADLTQDPALTADQGWWFWRVSEGVVGDARHPSDGHAPLASGADRTGALGGRLVHARSRRNQGADGAMNLAEYMMVATVIVFALAAAVALAWSVAAGQWRNRAEGARIVLDDDDSAERVFPTAKEV